MSSVSIAGPISLGHSGYHDGMGHGVAISDLTVRYGGKTVLDRLSLEIRRGEFLTVLGRSGCGKTTMLRFIAGFTNAAAGTLHVAGKDLTDIPPHKRNLGLLFQSYALFPHLSVFENVAFGLKARRLPKDQIRAKVEEALRLVRLDDAGKLMPPALSGGMQQRVALARALVIEPDVLLLDEPLSALDANLRASVRSELKALHARLPHLTVVCVTHDRDDALVLSDRTLLMRDGKIAQIGTPQELYDTPVDAFVAQYLGPANLLPSVLVAPQLGLTATDEQFACLRPERVRLDRGALGPFAGTVTAVEWHGALVGVFVELDRYKQERIMASLPRDNTVPEVGARVSLRIKSEDVVFVGR